MNIVEEVKKIPIKTVIELRIKTQGIDALCPFHNDNKMGSFKISNSKNIYKCFACGASGDGISFISKYDNISYLEAAYQIAYELELITESEYKAKKIHRKVDAAEKVDVIKNSDELAELQSDDMINLIYQIIANHPLSEKDEKYLREERLFTDEDLRIGKYFTMPSERETFKAINAALKLKGLKKDVLIGVPGFYLEGKKYRFASVAGIGIPIYGQDRKIVGIQVRTKAKKGESSRYLWISSAFANGKDDKKLGCGSGAPLGVIYPAEIKTNQILITEGNFKAVKYANHFGTICVTVQGVNSYEGIEFLLNSVRNKFFKNEFVELLVGYDADTLGNLNVFKASIGLVQKLLTVDKNISYLAWDEEDGKGLDDLIVLGNEGTIKKIPAGKYQHLYIGAVKELQKEDPELIHDKDLLTMTLKEKILWRD